MENNPPPDLEILAFKVTPEQKQVVRLEAAYAGTYMSDWLRDVVLEAAERSRKQRTQPA